MISTKTRILDAAEKLFAEQGFEATSLRDITTHARVNLASVNYHFRSKEELVRAVLARRLGPINQKRLEMLDEMLEKGPVCLEGAMTALYAPVLELHRDRKCSFQPLVGRIWVDPGPVREFFLDQMAPVARRFLTVVKDLLPDLPTEELLWRIHFSAALLAFTMSAPQLLEKLSRGACNPRDAEETTIRMVAFACAGLRAPWKGDSCSKKH